jgi:hypothetical protein
LAYDLLSHLVKADISNKSKLAQGGQNNEKGYSNSNMHLGNRDYDFNKHGIG